MLNIVCICNEYKLQHAVWAELASCSSARSLRRQRSNHPSDATQQQACSQWRLQTPISLQPLRNSVGLRKVVPKKIGWLISCHDNGDCATFWWADVVEHKWKYILWKLLGLIVFWGILASSCRDLHNGPPDQPQFWDFPLKCLSSASSKYQQSWYGILYRLWKPQMSASIWGVPIGKLELLPGSSTWKKR